MSKEKEITSEDKAKNRNELKALLKLLLPMLVITCVVTSFYEQSISLLVSGIILIIVAGLFYLISIPNNDTDYFDETILNSGIFFTVIGIIIMVLTFIYLNKIETFIFVTLALEILYGAIIIGSRWLRDIIVGGTNNYL